MRPNVVGPKHSISLYLCLAIDRPYSLLRPIFVRPDGGRISGPSLYICISKVNQTLLRSNQGYYLVFIEADVIICSNISTLNVQIYHIGTGSRNLIANTIVNSKDLEKTKKPIQNHDTVTAIT